ncbi:MAG: alpha/beta hydrolase [Hyphomicrobiales bacterium]
MIRIFVFSLVFLALTCCSSPPDAVIGVDNPATPAASTKGAVKHTIYIATTRAKSDDPQVLFTGEREPLSLNFAKVDVYVPPNHKVGYVERPSSVPPDPRNDFVILEPEIFADKTPFKASLNRDLKTRPRDQREVLLFVHGYNTDLVDAVLRVAQFKHDSGFTGIPVLFTWASRGKTLDYVYDLNSALHARDDLLTTADVVASTKLSGLNIVAHSMGNLLTVEAMRQDQLLGSFNSSGKIRTIVLASADIDADVFVKQLQPFPKTARKFYVLISENDKALAFSRRIAGGIDRVGDESGDKLAELGVKVIDLSKVDDTSSLIHSKFADSPEIVQLIGRRMNEGDSFVNPPSRSVLQNLPDAARVLVQPSGTGGILVFQ